MLQNEIEYLFSSLGRRLVREKEKVSIDLLGSAALVLGYKCWPKANDIDARWSSFDSFVLSPLIAEIANKSEHPLGSRWMNCDIADIVTEEGVWSKKICYGNLTVRIPAPEFLMSLLIKGLSSCEPGSTQYPPFGKSSAECVALAKSQQWTHLDIIEKTKEFFPKGIPPVCEEWLDRLFATSSQGQSNHSKWLEIN